LASALVAIPIIGTLALITVSHNDYWHSLSSHTDHWHTSPGYHMAQP
jgi:hypothetical protein